MPKKIPYKRISELGVGMLIILSMLLLSSTEIAGFSLYTLLLFLILFGWMVVGIHLSTKEGKVFWKIRNLGDMIAAVFLIIEVFTIIVKLFQNPENGDIGITRNVTVIVFVGIYFLFARGITFQGIYFDLLLYCGLLVVGIFLFPYFTEVQDSHLIEAVTKSTGSMASYLMLIGMVSVYQYCTCRDKLRSWFYLLVAGIDFFALFLNQNVISFWLMVMYFLAIPVVFRSTAALIKRATQMLALFGFMLSNMSLLTKYIIVLQKKVSFSIEHSVYLDLLLAMGGIFFFHYWDRIPEGMDLDRLVMRKMRKGYQFLLKVVGIVFVGILLSGNNWSSLPEGIGKDAISGFVIPLVTALQQEKSGFYTWFAEAGVIGSIVIIFVLASLLGKMKQNYQLDKPYTGILILISTIFIFQLFFWSPGIPTYTVYFILLLEAAFYKEKRVRITSTKIKLEEKGSKEENEKI
ncbi:MAG: hypothetical protein PUD93_00250 [Lachnospiraceae bacterium]|nr:hypothetical protein [Lachnospiraceae bacterium]